MGITKNQKGQTVVEYILLLAVAISLVMTFYNSEAYKRLFGTQGSVGKTMKEETEFGYRHAYQNGRSEVPAPYTGSNHPSYYHKGETRFFGPKEPYQ